MGIKSIVDKFKKQKNNGVSEEPPKEVVLYVLIEEVKMGIVDYFKHNGIEIKLLTNSIDDIRMGIILNDDVSRLLIVETGIGEFSLPEMKADIADLLGVCGEDKKDFTIMYATTSFKTDILKMSNVKDGDTARYENTISILAKLNEYNEVYKVGGAKDLTVDDVLNCQGKRLDIDLEQVNNDFTDDFTNINIKNTDEENIEAFEVKI